MGVSAVIISGKGGVGKSTITVGLGRTLAEKGRRVLLVDCDAGLRSLDRMTGVEQELVFDISDVVRGRCAPVDAIYPCAEAERLFMLPAPASQQDAVKPAVMKRFVPLLKRYYDYVLLDAPAGVDRTVTAAACAADKALVVCSPDPVCVRGSVAVREMLDELGVREKGLIINRFNGEFFDTVSAYEDLDAVIDDTGIRLMGVVPEDYSLAAAYLKGKAAPGTLRGMMAISRITARFEGEMIPIVL